MQYIFAIVIILIIILLWSLLYDSSRFIIRSYKIESNKINDNLKIVFLTDLHLKEYGQNNNKLIKAIDEISPDLILIGGDMITASKGKDYSSFRALLDSLSKYVMIFAEGNHEYRLNLYPEKYEGLDQEYINIKKEYSLNVLANSSYIYNYGLNNQINICGLSIDREYYKRFNTPIPSANYVEEKLGPKSNLFTILLAHNPKWFDIYSYYEADLILSGHYHGGIMGLPFKRGLISPDLRLFTKFSHGLYKNTKSNMILSAGLGAHTIPFRLFNPAELTVIDLVKKD